MGFKQFSIKIFIPLLASAVMSFSPLGGAAAVHAASEELEVIQEVMDYLNEYNIEGVEKQALIEGAIRGMVYALDDPYSDYFIEEELGQFQSNLNQQYVGIGVTLRFHNDKLYITDVLSGSPAESAGLQKGDIINKVDGKVVQNIDHIAWLQGKENSKVLVYAIRNGTPLNITITRGPFSLPALTSAFIPMNKVGYIHISSFTESVDQEFAKELSKLQKLGMKSLIIDLRNNLGGYVEAAKSIAEHFMAEGTLMYVKGQSGDLEPVEITDGKDIDIPVVILTNEYSASASEILTGALRDHNIATVVGTKTYGKARIQNLIPLSNGNSLKLTVLAYYTPDLEDFNEVGLTPDIEVMNNPAAQLITGLKMAGLRQLYVSGNAASLSINGIPFDGYLDTIQQGDNIYAPSRVLTALVDGTVSWDTKTQTLTISGNTGQKTFSATDKSVINVEGESYVELTAFQKKFPSVNWSNKQGNLNLSIK